MCRTVPPWGSAMSKADDIVKVVIQTRPEGFFRLSICGIQMFLERKGQRNISTRVHTSNGGYTILVNGQYFQQQNISREDPDLVAVVERFGEHAGFNGCEFTVCAMPRGTRYRIAVDCSDGTEFIEYPTSIEWKVAGDPVESLIF